MIVPQATLARIREWLQIVAAGELPSEGALGVSERHVAYARDGALALGLVRSTAHGIQVTPLGTTLLATRARTPAEAAVWRTAIEGSQVHARYAPDLFADPAPSVELLTTRLHAMGLSDSTARRRASTLLDWRRVVDEQSTSLFLAAEPDGQPREGLRLTHLRVEGFGLLREVAVDLERFAVIVGRNATGKSTLLDVPGFLADVLDRGVVEAVRLRATRFEELVWHGRPDRFGFALEATIPDDLAVDPGLQIVRYEVEFRKDEAEGVAVGWEQLLLRPAGPPPPTIRTARRPRGWRLIASLSQTGSAYYRAESDSRSWKTVFNIGTGRLALSNLPEDRDRLPVANRFRDALRSGVRRLQLDPAALRTAASPLLPRYLVSDGSNLALVVSELLRRDPRRFAAWLAQIREALPEVRSVTVVERAEDRHQYLQVEDRSGSRFPAWRLSEGTLRLLALTLIPYAAEPDAMFLIEEPENGIHPQALQVVVETFRNSPAQILVASHSPVLVGICEPNELLCFSRKKDETRVVRGEDHPVLSKRDPTFDPGLYFAAGVL
ncbi:MAG: AAA family ATPase [Myxococcota bacterium]